MDSSFDSSTESSSSSSASSNCNFQAETSTMNDSTQISSSDDSILVFSNLNYDPRFGWRKQINGEWEKAYLNLSSSSKLIIIDKLSIKSFKSLSSVLLKIYRFDAKELKLSNQNISYHGLLILSSNVEDLHFYDVTVKYDNGSIMPLEKIVDAFRKIKSITYRDSTPSSIASQTFNKLLKIPQFSTLNFCKLWKIPEDFDIESFNTYMKRNKRTRFYLRFSDSLSEVYKNRLEEIVNEIIEDKKRDYKSPLIKFPGLNEEKEEKLEERYYHQKH